MDKQRTEDLSQEQLQRLPKTLDEADNQPVAILMRLALCTGMSRGEMLKLKWQDLDFGRGFITLRAPRGGKSERIPMDEQARTLLNALPRDSDFVFPGKDEGRGPAPLPGSTLHLRVALARLAAAY